MHKYNDCPESDPLLLYAQYEFSRACDQQPEASWIVDKLIYMYYYVWIEYKAVIWFDYLL